MLKKKKNLFLILILIFLGFLFYFNRVQIKEYFIKERKIELPVEIKFEDIQNDLANEVENGVEDEFVERQGIVPVPDDKNNEIEDLRPNPDALKSEFSEEINLAIPFTIQSPDQKWDEPYKEGCEEASILMAQAFVHNENITVDSALEDIGAMIDWQMENYEGHFNLSASTTANMAREFLSLEAKLIYLESIDSIKEIIKTGYPLILPTAGRRLGNPNFVGEGPLYHMLVVKGFTHSTGLGSSKDNLIITNDPGTRKGENYIYEADVLWNAIADWDEKSKNLDQSIKVGIIIK